MEINNLKSLNKKAREFLLEHCVSKRGAEIIVYNFTGYINSNYFEKVDLIRKQSKWYFFATNFNREQILGLGGEIEGFCLTRNTIYG